MAQSNGDAQHTTSDELREEIYALDRLRVKTDHNLPRIGSVMARVAKIEALIKQHELDARLDEVNKATPNILAIASSANPLDAFRFFNKYIETRTEQLKAEREAL